MAFEVKVQRMYPPHKAALKTDSPIQTATFETPRERHKHPFLSVPVYVLGIFASPWMKGPLQIPPCVSVGSASGLQGGSGSTGLKVHTQSLYKFVRTGTIISSMKGLEHVLQINQVIRDDAK